MSKMKLRSVKRETHYISTNSWFVIEVMIVIKSYVRVILTDQHTRTRGSPEYYSLHMQYLETGWYLYDQLRWLQGS